VSGFFSLVVTLGKVADYLQDLLLEKIVESTIGCQYQKIALPDALLVNVGVLWLVLTEFVLSECPDEAVMLLLLVLNLQVIYFLLAG
jgi:hypothetical protein